MTERVQLGVFGRHLEVRREDSTWRVFARGEGTVRPLDWIRIPQDASVTELRGHLEDLFHEDA